VGHMSQSEAHVTNWVACHKTGHMSLMLWQIEPKSSYVPPYMGLNFPVPSFRTDILCHAQPSNITPKPLLCVGMKAFFCLDFFTFVSFAFSLFKAPPPLCGNPPARAQAHVGAGVPSLRARHRPELRPQIDFYGSVSLVL
jgi:hypothetical protein